MSAEAFFTYKGKPLLRQGDTIYYGDMNEKYVIMMQVLGTNKNQDMDIATKVSVQLMLTDPDIRLKDRMVKKSEKNGLYQAMDVAVVWLDRALSGKL